MATGFSVMDALNKNSKQGTAEDPAGAVSDKGYLHT